jgi:hypothetical protein
VIDNRDWLSTSVGLEDGSFIQNFADISDLKKQQKDKTETNRTIIGIDYAFIKISI